MRNPFEGGMDSNEFLRRCRALSEREDLDASPPAAPPTSDGRLERAGVPERFLACSIGNWQAVAHGQRALLGSVMAFASEPRDRWLAFLGGYGAGKTHLAVGCIRAIGGRYVTARGLVQRIMSATARWEEREKYVNARLLVVDEMPSGQLRDHEYEILYDVLDARYGARLPCVLIANATPEAFAAMLRPALVDRFREVGSVEAFDWESWRGRA